MEKIVKCRVITPLFSRGAQPAKNGVYPFELRPQSVKGVLRFWFRAIAPLVINIGYLDIDKLPSKERKVWEDEKCYPGLKYLESKIFGSQHNKAPFSITVDWNNAQVRQLVTAEKTNKKGKRVFKPKFHDVSPGKNSRHIAYSFYGTYSIDSKTGESEICSYLSPSSEPNLFIRFNVHCPNQDKEKKRKLLNVLLHVLRIVSIFSGFGAKTRKGYGEFEVVDKNFNRNPKNLDSYVEKVVKEAADSIRIFINHSDLSNVLDLEVPDSEGKMENFPTFTSYFFKPIPIEKEGWFEVMKVLYFTSRNSKGWYPSLKQQLRKHGEDTVKKLIKLLDGEVKGDVEVTPSILGLPLQYQNLKTHRSEDKITFFSHVDTEDKSRGRKASPMHISIHKKPNGKWYPWILILRSRITQNIDGKPILEKSWDDSMACEKDFQAFGFEDYGTLEKLMTSGGGTQ